MTMGGASPRLDRVDIGAASRLSGSANLWIATGITLPSDSMEEISLRLVWSARDDYQTGLFTVGRIVDDLGPTVAGVERTGGGITYIELVRLGVSAATGYYLGHTAEDELLILGPADGSGIRVELWTFRAEDVRIEDLGPDAQLRVLPEVSPSDAYRRVVVNADGTGYTLLGQGGDGETSDVYATPAQYRARTGATASVLDDLLIEQLTAASRMVDAELRVMPGYFAPHSGVYLFSPQGGQVLTLRDEDGLAYALRTVEADGIRPDYDLTGRYDQYAWDLDDAWIWPMARNALQLGRPYHALQLRRVGDVPITVWPWQDGSVQITGDWGWPATPTPIRELAIKVARDMRDSLRGGAAARVEAVDEGIAYRDDTWRLWNQVRRRYGRAPAMAR